MSERDGRKDAMELIATCRAFELVAINKDGHMQVIGYNNQIPASVMLGAVHVLAAKRDAEMLEAAWGGHVDDEGGSAMT